MVDDVLWEEGVADVIGVCNKSVLWYGIAVLCVAYMVLLYQGMPVLVFLSTATL